MSIRAIELLLAILGPAITAGAQHCVHNFDSDPTTGAGFLPTVIGQPNAGTQATGWHAQFLVHRSRFSNAPERIVDLGFAMGTDGVPTYGRITITMGHTRLDTLNSVGGLNFTGATQLVLDIRNHTWPQSRSTWTQVGLQSPFLYVPAAGNLLIDVFVDQIAFTQAPWVRHDLQSQGHFVVADVRNGTRLSFGAVQVETPKIRLCIDRADLAWFGEGCSVPWVPVPGLGLQGSAHPGSRVQVVLSNSRVNSLALLAFGWSTAPPFPRELGSLGMPGCRQYFDVHDTIGVVTDSRGIGSHSVAIPNQSSLIAMTAYVQFYPLWPGLNAAGALSTNYGRLLIGL